MQTAESFTPPPEAGATGDVMEAYTRVWPHLQVEVERCARKITKDRDERDDLIQEARLELWRVDASRCDLRSMDDLLYLRAMLTKHMKKVAVSRGLVKEAPSESVPEDVVKTLTQGSVLFAP